MRPGLCFHHVGVACADLDRESRVLADLGYRPESEDVVDPIQGVRLRFLSGGGPRLELIVPEGAGGVLTPWLSQGTKLYHLGYEADDLDAALTDLRAARGKAMVQPVPAVAFDGRRIAFVMLPNMLLIELIEVRSP